MFGNSEYRRLKRQFKHAHTYRFIDLYINQRTKQVFINNRGWFNNLIINGEISRKKYHLYNFSEIDFTGKHVERNGSLIEWIDYTIGFVDGYKYHFRIMSMTVEDNSHTAVGALEIVNQLDVILREPIVENMMSENSSRHHD